MKTPLDPRHARRRKIIQELFEWEARNKIKDQKSKIKNVNYDQKTRLIIKSLGKIDPLIETQASRWPKEKINMVDIAILRLAVYELVLEKKEPFKVVIDEAVELAKEFGGEGGPGFVNGVLGAVLKLGADGK